MNKIFASLFLCICVCIIVVAVVLLVGLSGGFSNSSCKALAKHWDQYNTLADAIEPYYYSREEPTKHEAEEITEALKYMVILNDEMEHDAAKCLGRKEIPYRFASRE